MSVPVRLLLHFSPTWEGFKQKGDLMQDVVVSHDVELSTSAAVRLNTETSHSQSTVSGVFYLTF